MNAPRFAFAMLALLVSLGLAPTRSRAESDRSWMAELLNPELRHIEQERAADERELAKLGAPVVGVTAEQLGYQHPRLDAPPLNPAWVQVDLRSSQPIDWIALIPAQLDFQSFDRTAYGFPKRFRVDISDDRRAQVARAVVEAGVGLLRLDKQAIELESIFQRLVHAGAAPRVAA